MKKFLLTSLIFIMAQQLVIAKTDYDQLYFDAQVPQIKFMHNIDPYQDEDYQRYTWSPYPLFRTSSTLYFKTVVIEPGYYLITPRNIKGEDVVLFKENGKVRHTVPVVRKTSTPMDFYATKVPQPKLTKWESICDKTRKKFFTVAKSSQRVPPPSAFIDAKDAGNYFLVKYYFGNDCYWLLFKKDQY